MHWQSVWDMCVTWLSENVLALIGVIISGFGGVWIKNNIFRTGVTELNGKIADLEQKIGRLETTIMAELAAERSENRELFRLLRQQVRDKN